MYVTGVGKYASQLLKVCRASYAQGLTQHALFRDCGKTLDALQSIVLETGVKKRLQCTSCESVGNHQADEVLFCALERGLVRSVVGNPRHQTARMHSRHENHAWWQTLFRVTHERISFKYGNQLAELGTIKAAPKDGFYEI